MHRQIADMRTRGKGVQPEDSAKRKTAISLVLTLVLVPTIVVVGELLDVGYYITSVLVIACTMMPFFVSFESRKPQARELAIIAVMCAIAIAARVVFMWLPSFKPFAGIVIIAGIALGAQAGFLTGVCATFVSNFIFGQGPWTPWQMFAFGVAGFLAGLLAKAGVVPLSNWTTRWKIAVSAFGFVFVTCVVGPILDTCSLFTFTSTITVEGAIAIYLSGMPFNVVHGIATALTLFFAGNPMLDTFTRVRVKYGMLE